MNRARLRKRAWALCVVLALATASGTMCGQAFAAQPLDRRIVASALRVQPAAVWSHVATAGAALAANWSSTPSAAGSASASGSRGRQAKQQKWRKRKTEGV